MSHNFLVYIFMLSTLPVYGQVIHTKDSLEIHRTDTIYFPFNSAAVGADAGAKIREMAADRPGDLQLYLEGHTDAVGTNQANEKLAAKRSQATYEEILLAGWPEDAVEVRHFGERHLLVNTPGREQRNRRVLLRSGLPKKYVLLTGYVLGEAGQPLAGGAIAHGTFLRDTTVADRDGKFEIWLPVADSIRLDIFARDHFIDNRVLYFEEHGAPPPPLEVSLVEAGRGKRLDIDNLYFYGNQTTLMPGGITALERLYHFMVFNEHLRIELAGHVNQPGVPKLPGTRLHYLAGARAKVVYTYLVERGIDPERMRYSSYSNYEMVNPDPKGEEEMRANRRVEIRVR
ncbi:OmpA family protein [Neolewinella antarctica]|uniref:Outer membrane protein OmpA-like peptidoglycan-associated protein n=1 Tax=Neolewinella antarctica TaxID=442734 RepID=A0ABX0X823_9BACT|nr:OmpA family protein [Neolewinella antarctica]NJC25297.1 outer membrane protein OmpA-like peptidoglycan-associated protein [Neolewinella antarctica]